MRNLLGILAVVMAAGCGPPDPLVSTMVTIDAGGAPEPIVDIMEDAVALWDQHGLHFYFEPDGNVRVHEADRANLIGEWAKGEGISSDIWLSRDSRGLNITCLAAHYLGISLGFGEPDRPGLTGDGYNVREGHECPWNAQDDQQVAIYLEYGR